MPTFTENWFGVESQKALTELAERTDGLPGAVVEIGAWEGRSTVALAAAVPDMVHTVDTWEGSPGEISEQLAVERDVYSRFLANVDGLNIVPHRQSWRDYFVEHDGPVRFCFIDAEHSYREVKDSLETVLPLLVDGGIVCGDDNHHPPVQQAVVDVLGDAHVVATLWWWQKPSLTERYEQLCRTPSDMFLHLPRLHDLVLTLDAQHVIELGTRSGVSTVAFLHALEQTGGQLTSVDIDPAPSTICSDRWTFIQGDDLDPDVTSRLEPADIVFIDTSHAYEQTLAELNVYRWLVKPGGRIVLHDTQLEHPQDVPRRPAFPVRAAVVEFCESEGFVWSEHPECFGLGVIEVV